VKARIFWIIVSILILGLSACQSKTEETQTVILPMIEGQGENDADPAEDAYPLDEPEPVEGAYPLGENPPSGASAYPIVEENLQFLIQTWTLANYAENGVVQELQEKSLTINADGSYEMTTSEGRMSGEWRSQVDGTNATLTLNPDNGEALTYEIIDINETLLNLRFWREDVQIDELFLPAE
jgi:hypothetical protein